MAGEIAREIVRFNEPLPTKVDFSNGRIFMHFIVEDDEMEEAAMIIAPSTKPLHFHLMILKKGIHIGTPCELTAGIVHGDAIAFTSCAFPLSEHREHSRGSVVNNILLVQQVFHDTFHASSLYQYGILGMHKEQLVNIGGGFRITDFTKERLFYDEDIFINSIRGRNNKG